MSAYRATAVGLPLTSLLATTLSADFPRCWNSAPDQRFSRRMGGGGPPGG